MKKNFKMYHIIIFFKDNDPCSSISDSICLNGGICSPLSNSPICSYRCICLPGFIGNNCENSN